MLARHPNTALYTTSRHVALYHIQSHSSFLRQSPHRYHRPQCLHFLAPFTTFNLHLLTFSSPVVIDTTITITITDLSTSNPPLPTTFTKFT